MVTTKTPKTTTRQIGKSRSAVGHFLVNNGLLAVLIVMVLLFGIVAPRFLSLTNIRNIFTQVSIESLIAVPMTMVIVSAQIDLSVGAMVGLSGAITGFLMVKHHVPFVPTVLVVLAAGFIVGWLNGYISLKLRIPTFIVTLAMMTSIGGIALELTQGYPISGFPESFSFWGQGFVGPIPTPVIFMFVIFVIGYWAMSNTSFGRKIYAVGGNEEAARLSGIRVRFIKITVMVLSGVVSALAGILLASRLTSGIANAGDSYMLDVIAAVIIGGTDLFGGAGDILGTLLGVLFMGVLANGLVLVGVDPFMHLIVQGLIVLLAVALNSIKNRTTVGSR